MAKLLNIPIDMMESLDKIFSAILIGGLEQYKPVEDEYIPADEQRDLRLRKADVRKVAKPKFLANFQYNIFNDYYAVFYEMLVTDKKHNFNTTQLYSILDNHKDLVVDSPYIDKDKYKHTANGNAPSDDEFFNAFKLDIIEKFIELSHREVELDEFETACSIYTSWYKTAYMESVCQEMSVIMQDMGLDVKLPGKRTKHYQGYLDAQEYYSENLQILKSLDEENQVKNVVLDAEWYEDEISNIDADDDLALFGTGIEEIDSCFGDFRRSNMVGIIGPPKGGKTRFANYLVNRALEFGYNVCVWTIDGTKEEWIATQTATLIASESFRQYKAGKIEHPTYLDASDILNKKYKSSKVVRSIVASAKHTMAVNEHRGRLSFIEASAYVEDFLELLKAHYENNNPFDVIVIDQLINIGSKTHGAKSEVISRAYMDLKRFISTELKVPALAIVPCQLKQDVVDYMRTHEDATMAVTSGGESAETIRTPDFTIGLFSTEAERNSNIMKFFCVATRHTKAFSPFTAKTHLGSCFFVSASQESA